MKRTTDKKIIRFSDLSGHLKFAIVMAWIVGIFYIILFGIGFIIGIIGTIK